MRKRKEIFVILITLLGVFFVGAIEAAKPDINAKVLVSKGKILITSPQGQKTIYEKMGEDFLIIPQTKVLPVDGLCVIKVGDMQFILDTGDSLTYESAQDLQFKCESGCIEAICGENTFRLVKGEVIALADKSGTVEWSASKARFSTGNTRQLAIKAPDGGPIPFQAGPYGPRSHWTSPYF